ncbi:MAG TPA: hypothetical protein VHE61_07435 [Opitutaceae bacterium]|nr:hypothetical protein [Opitutaceae bacterium]
MSYEMRDASLPIIGIGAGVMAVCVAAAIGISAWMYSVRYRHPSIPSALRQTSFRDGPEQEPDINRDWRRVNAAAKAHLANYAWVDRHAGIARIPIDRAMALVAAGVSAAPTPKPTGQIP